MKYVKGILAGLVGGIIGSLPWVLMYVFGNYLVSLLAAVIAFGIAFAYKLVKAPKDKYYPIIVAVLSIIIVVVVTLVVIPLAELANEGFPATIANLKLLYDNSEFVSGILKDLVISVIFTILGISGVVARAKQELVLGDNDNN